MGLFVAFTLPLIAPFNATMLTPITFTAFRSYFCLVHILDLIGSIMFARKCQHVHLIYYLYGLVII